MRDGDMQHFVWYAMFIKFPINHIARRMGTCDFSIPYRRNHEFRLLHTQKNNYMQCTFTCVLTDTCIYMYIHKNTIYICMHDISWIWLHGESVPVNPERFAQMLWSEKSEGFNQPGTPSATYWTKQQKKKSKHFSDFCILNRGSVGTEVVEVPSSKIFCNAFTEAQRDLSFGSFKRWKTLGAQLSRDSKAWARSRIGWKTLSKRLALSLKVPFP